MRRCADGALLISRHPAGKAREKAYARLRRGEITMLACQVAWRHERVRRLYLENVICVTYARHLKSIASRGKLKNQTYISSIQLRGMYGMARGVRI